MSSHVVHAKMLIGGEWVDGATHFEVRNPARPADVVGTAVRARKEDVLEAIAAAKKTQLSWAKLSFVERAEMLEAGIAAYEEGIEQRGILYTQENGRVLAEALGELRSVPISQRLTLELAPKLDEGRQLAAANGRTIVSYIPFGVVVSIVPWNAPVTLAFLQVVPALLAGNAVVVKPPESCPLAVTEALGVLASKLPQGLINVVTGKSSEIGDTLTLHPDVAKIGFTGGIPAAKLIMSNAAQTIKNVTLELGGNDAAIVLKDVDLGEQTMRRMAHGAFAATGQVCMAVKRVYVHEEVAPAFIDAFSRVVDQYVIGDGLKNGITMGPMHTSSGRQGALALVEDSRKRGATVRSLGQVVNDVDFNEGYFVRPTIVTDIDDDAPLMVEEQFCPVLPITTFRDVNEVVARANASIFGLCASVWSRDVDAALPIARRMEAGTVFVNTHGVAGVNRKAPYGGIKQSGIGSKASVEGVMEYLQLQTITTVER